MENQGEIIFAPNGRSKNRDFETRGKQSSKFYNHINSTRAHTHSHVKKTRRQRVDFPTTSVGVSLFLFSARMQPVCMLVLLIGWLNSIPFQEHLSQISHAGGISFIKLLAFCPCWSARRIFNFSGGDDANQKCRSPPRYWFRRWKLGQLA